MSKTPASSRIGKWGWWRLHEEEEEVRESASRSPWRWTEKIGKLLIVTVGFLTAVCWFVMRILVRSVRGGPFGFPHAMVP